jgi:signal transduction histidine kinase
LLRAQEKERRRISLELHDELGQSLSLLKVQLGAVKRKLRPDQMELGEALQETREHLDYVIESVRRLSRDLSPSILEDLGLSAAIEWLISDFAKHYNISTSYDAENIDDFFSDEHQIIIYRIFQEILSNIRKHAEADQVSVAIRKQKGAVSFLVQDNGNGFDLKEVSGKNSTEKGMGLTAMYERALIVGSSLDIWTEKGKGVRISFTVPVGN